MEGVRGWVRILIRLLLPNVMLHDFNMSERKLWTLANEYKDTGYYEAIFDGSSLASGTYIYRIESGSFVSAKKMVMLK